VDLDGRGARLESLETVIVGIGVDAVDIERIERMFASKSDRMLNRLFLAGEVAFLSGKNAPAQHLAVRLAAKEAAYKALSGNELARGIGWRDVEVMSREDGAPELRLHGRAAERLAELGGTTIHVSLTHSAMTAIAVVIIER
jgi:holo-[acyl-carrier protein] synthase